uniref:Charged multivesicular body protein 1b n=1 Tax=Pseudictyota dubia TaxID=2749911 RepID=A0A7R9WCX5_9STRA
MPVRASLKKMMPGGKPSLEDELINLRITSKTMQRSAKKCEKNEKAAIEKLKKAIKQGNAEGARIHGQDAIREKNQALNCLKMASRIDAVSSRIETAVRMGTVTSSMKGVVRGMDKGLASMNIEQLSKTMDKFESQFEDLDVRMDVMDNVMNSTTATTTPSDQVDELVAMVADENNLELGETFAEAGLVGKIKEPKAAAPATAEDDLDARLANLRS